MSTQPREVITLREERRGHLVKVEIKVSEITHFVAGQKYVTAYFLGGEQLIKDSIVKLEKEFGADFISPHRGALVRRSLAERMDRAEMRLYLLGVSEPVKLSKLRAPAIAKLMEEQANG